MSRCDTAGLIRRHEEHEDTMGCNTGLRAGADSLAEGISLIMRKRRPSTETSYSAEPENRFNMPRNAHSVIQARAAIPTTPLNQPCWRHDARSGIVRPHSRRFVSTSFIGAVGPVHALRSDRQRLSSVRPGRRRPMSRAATVKGSWCGCRGTREFGCQVSSGSCRFLQRRSSLEIAGFART